jgi:ribbon-helix-helix CopG family protein
VILRLATYGVKVYAPPMIRTTVWLSEQQVAALRKMARKTGLKAAELLRRAVDEFISKERTGPIGPRRRRI